MNLMVGQMTTGDFSYREWLKRALAQKHVSQSELARRWGKTPDIVSRILLGKRKLSADELAEIARLLNIAPPLTGPDPNSFKLPTDKNSAIIPLAGSASVPIIGIVEAGAYRPLSWFDGADLGVVMSGYDPRFPKELQKGWLVRGNDNEAAGIGDGDQIVTVDPWAAGISLTNGSMVVIEKLSPDGSTRELTLRELHIAATAITLIARTTDPRFQPEELPPQTNLRAGSPRIVGVVIAALRRFPQQFITSTGAVVPVDGPKLGKRVGKAFLAAAVATGFVTPCHADAMSFRPFWHKHADGTLHLHEGYDRHTGEHEDDPLHQNHQHLVDELGIVRDRKAALLVYAAHDKKMGEAHSSDSVDPDEIAQSAAVVSSKA